MRSTKTATSETGLHWERVGGAHAGIVAEYGPWRFKVYAWQPGSYLATATNSETGEHRRTGDLAGMKQGEGRIWCESIYQEARATDRRCGITR
jgi:hypothetical protein